MWNDRVVQVLIEALKHASIHTSTKSISNTSIPSSRNGCVAGLKHLERARAGGFGARARSKMKDRYARESKNVLAFVSACNWP